MNAELRLPHCTPLLGEHNLLCDRDGKFCGLNPAHDGPCKPHGTPSPEGEKRAMDGNR